MNNINIKRMDKIRVKQITFECLGIGTVFEDPDDEGLYIKVSTNEALQLGDICLTCFGGTVVVNEVEVEINYKRKYEDE